MLRFFIGSPRTKKALLEWKSHLEITRHRKRIHPIETRFVFCRLNGQPIKRFDSAWRNICKIAKIKDFHYHDLRHTFCSNLLNIAPKMLNFGVNTLYSIPNKCT